VTLFTVPAGQTWLVKTLTAYSLSGAASSFQVLVVVPPAVLGTITEVWRTDTLGMHGDSLWRALDPGASLQIANASAATGLNVMAYGAKLLGSA